MAAEPRTLNVPERQVLVDFWDDAAEFYWHHRLLLSQTGTPGRWIWATPDFEVAVADLTTHRVVPLQRDEEFPADYRGYIYSFDPEETTENRIEVMRRQARALSEIMGAPSSAPPEGSSWRIADTAHSAFGQEIPTSILNQGEFFITRGRVGLVAFDPADEDEKEWVLAELVDVDSLDDWRMQKQAGHGRDHRLIGDIRVGKVREVSFVDALARTKPVPTAQLPGWPHEGERATYEFLRALKLSGLEWITHHNDFVTKSGLSRGAGVTRAHRRVSEALQLMMQWDQLDLSNSAAAESLLRFLIAIESAVRRNPRAPDFSLFDEITGGSLDEVGGVSLPGFTKWLADVQRDKAQVMKQYRLWTEEQTKTGPSTSGGGDSGGGASATSGGGGGGGRGGKGGRGGRGGRGNRGGAAADP